MLWMPFILKSSSINNIQTKGISFETVLKNWDGPLYIIPAKTLYDKNNPILQSSPMGYDPKYFAAHLPLYPLTLRLAAPFMGYPRATVASTLITSIMLVCFFYFFVTRLKLAKHPLILSLLFLFVTPRFFVVRSVGSPEPLFLLLTLISIFYFVHKRYWLAGLFGGLSVMTKSPGILLFGSYFLFFVQDLIKSKKINFNSIGTLLIPFGLFLVFLLYYVQSGDFLAYFHSGDNIHLLFPPFSVFNYQKIWVDSGWLEDILFIYFFYGLCLTTLFSRLKHFSIEETVQNRSTRIFFYYTFIFFVSIISVQHRDISRYALPILPIALITFEEFFASKKVIIVVLLLLPAIYFYGWNFILTNSAPIADWTPFL